MVHAPLFFAHHVLSIAGKGLHSSTSQVNVSTFGVIRWLVVCF